MSIIFKFNKLQNNRLYNKNNNQNQVPMGAPNKEAHKKLKIKIIMLLIIK
jgi:hypothetical protein